MERFWILVPWAVLALAAGIKIWQITVLLRRHLLGGSSATERFRQSLERAWTRDQQAA